MSNLKILTIHNEYKYYGGEDVVVESESDLLSRNGISVDKYIVSNKDTLRNGYLHTASALSRSHYNKNSFAAVKEVCKQTKPDLAHVHNCWFSLSPAIYSAIRSENIPVVQTLHNYRLLCVNAKLFRGGKPCMDCVGKGVWQGILHGCYHDSRVLSAVAARMIQQSRRRRTWTNEIDTYIALNDFCRNLFVESGIPARKIAVKPNFVQDSGHDPSCRQRGGIFIGRLSEEKGVDLLLNAWKGIDDYPLTIVGDGPLAGHAAKIIAAENLGNIRLLGRRSRSECLELLRKSAFLVFPSLWYETFGNSIVESFSCGRPVIAANQGAMAELVVEGGTGLLFNPGDANDLAARIRWMIDNSGECKAMGLNARTEYERKYTAEKNFETLIKIYKDTIRKNVESIVSR